MSFDGDRVIGTTTIDERHEGAIGFAHGGALATLLDDAMGAMLFALERPAVTARLEVDYRKPAYLHQPLEVTAWSEGIDGRKLRLASAIKTNGEVIAEGHALFIQVDVDHFLKGQEHREADAVGDRSRLPW